MKTFQTPAIILSRTDYGEADRIVRILTRGHGKLSIMARGSRRPKSKLAGAIELFSVSELTLAEGKSEIKTLISARLTKHFQNIVKDIDRVQGGYEFVKMLNRATEDMPEPAYFDLLIDTFSSLDDLDIDMKLIQIWFEAGLLATAGHAPNLRDSLDGKELSLAKKYRFDYDSACFEVNGQGLYSSDDIKFLRLLFAGNKPKILTRIDNYNNLVTKSAPLIRTMLTTYIRL